MKTVVHGKVLRSWQTATKVQTRKGGKSVNGSATSVTAGAYKHKTAADSVSCTGCGKEITDDTRALQCH